MKDKNTPFMEEHIFSRIKFEDHEKEETPQTKAAKAFYAVWSNYIFINPTTENLRETLPEQYAIIKKLSYGAKNRLQAYIAYHLKKDHYDMRFENFNDMEVYSTIEMCREIFDDTKILFDWWRDPISSEINQTGEDWFQECRERFQHRKQINKLAYLIINLKTKMFLHYDGEKVSWTRIQKDATNFNIVKNDLIEDQSLDKTKLDMILNLKSILDGVNIEDLKLFNSTKETNSNLFNF